MKKLLTLALVLMAATSAFAQSTTQVDINCGDKVQVSTPDNYVGYKFKYWEDNSVGGAFAKSTLLVDEKAATTQTTNGISDDIEFKAIYDVIVKFQVFDVTDAITPVKNPAGVVSAITGVNTTSEDTAQVAYLKANHVLSFDLDDNCYEFVGWFDVSDPVNPVQITSTTAGYTIANTGDTHSLTIASVAKPEYIEARVQKKTITVKVSTNIPAATTATVTKVVVP